MTAPYYIQGIPFPDTGTIAAYFGETYDIDEWADTFPNGLSEAIAYLRFMHRELSDTDINTLAAAVHAHATRPDQDLPLRASLRGMVKGHPIYAPPTRPGWEDEHDNLATLPPALRTTQAPSLLARFARILSSR